MNNPLEAVTQAVNSLVTALKLPDESAKANEVLGEMSFPQFSRLLPYRDYNQESGLFMNDTTMGFMLEAIPINGANESIVEALDHMLRTKLPRGIPLCIHLMSSQLVGDRIEYGLREFSWSGEQAERFNAITRAYYMKAAATQFPLPEGMNLPLTLRHYRVFISYCSPSKKKSRADILEMENLVKIIRASLQGASITTQTVDAQAFIDIVGEMINHNPDSLYPKRRQLDPYSDLNYQCVEDSFDLKVRADYLTLGLRENGRNSTARILNFHLARNPDETKYYGGVTAGGDGGLKNDGTTEWATGETGKTITESFMNKPKDILSPDAPFIQTGRDVVNRADSIVGNTGHGNRKIIRTSSSRCSVVKR